MSLAMNCTAQWDRRSWLERMLGFGLFSAALAWLCRGGRTGAGAQAVGTVNLVWQPEEQLVSFSSPHEWPLL